MQHTKQLSNYSKSVGASGPISAEVSIFSSSSRASSWVDTGVLPFLTVYLGPRTRADGFVALNAIPLDGRLVVLPPDGNEDNRTK